MSVMPTTNVPMDDNRPLGWDEDFVVQESDFVTLEEGDYDFEIVSFERTQYSGSDKVPPCMRLDVKLRVTDGVNTTTLTEKMFLLQKFAWKLSDLLVSVGAAKTRDNARPSMITQCIGMKGRCHVTKTPGNNAGTFFNNVSKFHKKAENQLSGFTPAPSATPPAQFTSQPQQYAPPQYQMPQQPQYQAPQYQQPNFAR